MITKIHIQNVTRVFWIFISLLMTIALSAQTQRGFVKTKGRMVNGKHVSGKGLPGASVTIQGGNIVGVKNTDGSFSFVVPAQAFLISAVRKNGYQLVDEDVVTRPFKYSANPIYLVMETPEQQIQDKLDAESKLRRTLQHQLQKREDEIKAMTVSLQEKQRLLQELYQTQQSNEKLIAEMAKQYAAMDYDQMDDLNQRISDAILNGRLTEADSLLHMKGDISTRFAEIKREQQIEADEEIELTKRQKSLALSKEGTQKKLEDTAEDCYKLFNICIMENQHDSAAYYIKLRAELDTTNADWQFDAASYLHQQNQYQESESYYNKALEIFRKQAEITPQTYEPIIVRTLNNLAIIYAKTRIGSESMSLFYEALELNRKLFQNNPQAYELTAATILNNLAIWYLNEDRYEESEQMFLEALRIRRKLADQDQQKYEYDIAVTLNNLGNLYQSVNKIEESTTCYKEALSIFERYAQRDEETFTADVVATLNNLATLFYRSGQIENSKHLYRRVVLTYCNLAEKNPFAYNPYLEEAILNIKRIFNKKDEDDLLAKASIFEQMSTILPAYRLEHASTLNSLAVYYDNQKQHDKSEQVYLQALDLYQQLAAESMGNYKHFVARGYSNLSYHYLLIKDFKKAEQYAEKGLKIDGTANYIYTNLALAILMQGRIEEAESIYMKYKNELKDFFVEDIDYFMKNDLIPLDKIEYIKNLKVLLTQ